VRASRQRVPSRRTKARVPAASASCPLASKATANTGPTSTSLATGSQSRPPLRDASNPLSVASSNWCGSLGCTASASAPRAKLSGFSGSQVSPASRLRNTPFDTLESCARTAPGHPTAVAQTSAANPATRARQ
jgi:hypothetical protein